MKTFFHAAVTAASVWALIGTPAMAQSSGSAPAGTEQGSTSGTGATDQAGSQPGSEGSDGVTGTGPRGTRPEGSTAGTTGTTQHDDAGHAGMKKGTTADRAFIEKAAAGSMAEVALGKLAASQAGSADVKKFGEMMVTDHGKAISQLMTLADAQQVTPPRTLRPQEQALHDRLQKMSGDEFDRAYIAAMVEDHEKDVAEFKKASTTLTDARLKEFAGDTLPTLQKHLQDARTVHARLTGGAKGTSGSTSSPHGATGGSDAGAGAGHGSTSPTGATPPRPPQF